MEKKNKTTKILMHDIPLRLIKVLNIICLTIPFAGCWYGYYSGQMKDGFYNRGNLLMIALFMLVYFLFARIYNAFLISVNRISEMVYSQVLAALITDGISYLIIALLVKGFPNIIPGVMAIAGQIVMSLIWCFLAHRWYFRSFPPQKTMIVYDVREGMEKLIDQYDLECKFEVTEIIQVTDVINHLEKLNTIETVFLSGIHSHERNIILKYCIEHRIQVYVIPRVGDVLMSGAPEIVRILATQEYYEAIYIMPPIAAGVFFTAFANIYSDIAVYYKKTQYVMYPAIIAAGANLILNYIFIKAFGYMAAAYTTLASYVLMSVCQGLWANKLCREKGTSLNDIYDSNKMIVMAVITLVLCLFGMLLYHFFVVRYIAVVSLFMGMVLIAKRVKDK